MTTTYAVKHSHGVTNAGFATYDDAIAAVREVYGDCAIGHSGDIEDGGERTLVWSDEDAARDDDGSRAVCSITKRHDLDVEVDL